ncbi:hypothetical protein Mp_6g02330 [Marchantia polymorpha subsp. ruderalis]|uniref:Uncharacterized protein n=2 Tax=Marchantia polymorpha TaxID=3197 RepID=A0AAF6BMQ0_MARPO|nr:hypothetical protein MARPO_0035s0018 [Marchantia polymorpha]BBN13284.1 hypothetical protein Mp_6g02330 [Marchantia polymorpha subsp. ruderalis]|eukprot:PTQ41210.1 hypothetical protein MARPO_0035s0018 [Marchantia polymorpha]
MCPGGGGEGGGGSRRCLSRSSSAFMPSTERGALSLWPKGAASFAGTRKLPKSRHYHHHTGPFSAFLLDQQRSLLPVVFLPTFVPVPARPGSTACLPACLPEGESERFSEAIGDVIGEEDPAQITRLTVAIGAGMALSSSASAGTGEGGGKGEVGRGAGGELTRLLRLL